MLIACVLVVKKIITCELITAIERRVGIKINFISVIIWGHAAADVIIHAFTNIRAINVRVVTDRYSIGNYIASKQIKTDICACLQYITKEIMLFEKMIKSSYEQRTPHKKKGV